MNLMFRAVIVTLGILFIISLIYGLPVERQKRALLIEMCPNGTTIEECYTYAENKHKDMEGCFRFDVTKSNFISTQSCGVLECTDNYKVVEDLTKPYPDCCKTCEKI